MEVCRLSDEKKFLREVMRELRRLREELEELRLLRFAADEMRSLRKKILSSRYD
jgi:hypothetical protein